MTKDELRRRAETFNEEIGRESYRAGAGLTARTDFHGIFTRHAVLADDSAWEAARGGRALEEFAVDFRIGRLVAPLDDRMHTWETSAVINLSSHETIAWQKAGISIANERDRPRRLAIDAARRALTAEPAALRAERLGRERDELERLLGTDVVSARQSLSGIDLDALAVQCDAFLAQTDDMYREVLADRLRRDLGLKLADAHRSDAAFLFRGAAFDEYFRGDELVAIARRQALEMGIDAEAGGRVRLDVAERELKRARAFCAPVRVPDEVWLVIRPHGGYVDYRAFWHELGHALHFGNASRELPFEHRWLGDNSVTEAYAMLFEHMLVAPRWLTRYSSLSGERLTTFLRDQALNGLAVMRRYAAKLRYELQLHRSPSLERGAARYVELLSQATLFRYDDEDALLDLDDGFYAARYLRAWQLEAGLRTNLIERFDEDYFRNPRAGPVVLDLLSQGQRRDAAELSREVLAAPLGFGAVVRLYSAALN